MKANGFILGFAVLIFSCFAGCHEVDNSDTAREKTNGAKGNVEETSVSRGSHNLSAVKEQVDSESVNKNNTEVAKRKETVENTSEGIISFPNIFDAFTRLYPY